jgi:hypothetical protein
MSSHTMAAKPAGATPDSFPKWVLYFAGGIIAFSLISVGFPLQIHLQKNKLP